MKVFSRAYPTEQSTAAFWSGDNLAEIKTVFPDIECFCVAESDGASLVGSGDPCRVEKGEWLIRWFGGDYGVISAEMFHKRFTGFKED